MVFFEAGRGFASVSLKRCKGRGVGLKPVQIKRKKKFTFRSIFVTEVQRGLITRRPTIVFFLDPTKPLPPCD
jgi:hypothetical protein